MTELAQIAAQFGFPALIAVIILIAYQQLVKQLIEVVRTNTAVAEHLTGCINDHDLRTGEQIGRLEQPIVSIVETTRRIETKLDQHHSRLQ